MIDHYSIRIKENYAIGSAINTDSNNEHYVYNYTFLPYFDNCKNDESLIQWMPLTKRVTDAATIAALDV